VTNAKLGSVACDFYVSSDPYLSAATMCEAETVAPAYVASYTLGHRLEGFFPDSDGLELRREFFPSDDLQIDSEEIHPAERHTLSKPKAANNNKKRKRLEWTDGMHTRFVLSIVQGEG
jgi:hypothetical protein